MSIATQRAALPASLQGRGFTLIEMAVVLLVVALILGSILVPLNAQVQQRNMAETRRILEETRQALLGYAMIHGHLPQPAKSAADGTERDTSDVTKLCTPAKTNNCTGFLPWAVLGTPRGDAWGKLLLYSVNPAFTNYKADDSAGNLIQTSQFSPPFTGERTVKSRDPSGAELILAEHIPAVVLSQGARNLGTTVDGATIADSPIANSDEDANAAAGAATFWSRSPADSAVGSGGEFDDIVVWIPPAVLFSQLVAAGKLP